VAILHDFQQVVALTEGHYFQPPVIQDQQVRFGQLRNQFGKAPITMRELRKQVTFAIYAELDDLDRVTSLVDELFTLLEKADRI
jgi:hypothetical protein